MLGWQFPTNDSKEEEGLADAGIETFRSAPLTSIARESSQNSIDAAEENKVKVIFRLKNIARKDIPNINELASSLNACLQKATSRSLSNDKIFFETALETIKKETIPVLLVEDYGTTGLRGPAEPGNPFHALVRASGISQKSSEGAGGSFGIGKNAAFAISDIRTVFYSTFYHSNQKETHLVQGKSILVSRDEPVNGVTKPLRAKGYWGESGYEPVTSPMDIPNWLLRTQQGTTVASLGFNQGSDWNYQIIATLILNFFAAIKEEKVEFEVIDEENNGQSINSASIGSLFTDENVMQAAEAIDIKDSLFFSSSMYRALHEGNKHIKTFENLGEIQLSLLEADELPRKVGILRNGMFITDNLKNFQEQFARFPMSRDFVAVIEPLCLQSNKILREMENPSHDEFSAERISDNSRRAAIRRDMRSLARWAREIIRSSTREVAEKEISLDETAEFFADVKETGDMPNSASKDNNPESRTISPISLTRSKPKVGAGKSGESGSSGGLQEGQKGSSSGATTGDRKGKGRGLSGGRGGRSIEYSDLRNIVVASGNKSSNIRRIYLTPLSSSEAFLEISAIGLSYSESLAIKKINGEKTRKNPTINLIEGERLSLEIEFDKNYTGPITVVLTPKNGEEDEG